MSGAILAGLVVYLLVAKVALGRPGTRWGMRLFALANIAGIYGFFYLTEGVKFSLVFPVYVMLAVAQFLALRRFATRPGALPWVAFAVPILALIVIKYTAFVFAPVWRILGRHGDRPLAEFFVGISYFAFRTSRLVLEVRNGAARMPGLWEYLGYSFFVPTMAVGPISTFASHQRSIAAHDAKFSQWPRALMRILVGATKYFFLAGLCTPLTYDGLLRDGHPHHRIDLLVSGVFYYLFLYCNFSGFCDLAIGAAGLLGVKVEENFDNPFAARNVKEFWNRWHITLSQYMRDVVFGPLSKYLIGVFGPARANHAVAAAIVAVFLLVGVWHGFGAHYAAFGAAHAAGVVGNHYYTIALKKWLGTAGFRAYNQNRLIQALAVGLTFSYVAATLFLFANDFSKMREIFSTLR